LLKLNINWVDNLKFIGILAVILGHISSPFSSFIFAWHMPLFFIVAGFFINFTEDFKTFFLKSFKRLMLPYFIFSLIGLSIEIIKRNLLNRESIDILNELQGIFIYMDMESLINSYAFVLWFLPALFFAKLILYLIKNYVRNKIIQILVVLVLFLISFQVELPFGLDNALNGLIFIFIGNIYFDSYQDSKLLYVLPFIAIGIAFFFIPALDMASKNYDNLFINIIFSISTIYLFIMMFKYLNITNSFLTTWGNNSMLLFIFHPYTNNVGHIFVEKLQFGDWYLKLLISLTLLQVLLYIKIKFENRGIFKYV